MEICYCYSGYALDSNGLNCTGKKQYFDSHLTQKYIIMAMLFMNKQDDHFKTFTITYMIHYITVFLLSSDINECNITTNPCEQYCINNNGSFVCECNDGYTLDVDGFTCNG